MDSWQWWDDETETAGVGGDGDEVSAAVVSSSGDGFIWDSVRYGNGRGSFLGGNDYMFCDAFAWVVMIMLLGREFYASEV